MFPVVKAVPVRELVTVVVPLDLLDLQALVPGVKQRDLGAAVVLDVALAANERAHLLSGAVHVRVVGHAAIALAPAFDRADVGRGLRAAGERGDAQEEAWTCRAQLHAAGIVAIDARHRVSAWRLLEVGGRTAGNRV